MYTFHFILKHFNSKMEYLTYLPLKLWNVSPNLISNIVKRCSNNNLTQDPKDLSKEEISSQNRWPLWRFFLYFYLTITVLRFWAVSLVLFTGGKYLEYQQYDVLMSIGMDMRLVNFNTGIFVSPLTIFIIHYDYTVYVKRFNNVCRLAHDIMVVNTQNFFALNPQFKPIILLREPIKSVKGNLRILSWFYKPPKKEVFSGV